MHVKNTEKRFGVVAISFHWVMAIIMIGLIILGLYMIRLPDSDGKFALYDIHKEFGLIILGLVFLRFGWRYINIIPSLDSISRLEHYLALFVQWMLYFCMVAMPITGLLMTSAAGYQAHFFGLVVPSVMEPNKVLAPVFAFLHEWIGYSLIGLIVLHVLGALKHHFYDKSDVLKRMLSPND